MSRKDEIIAKIAEVEQLPSAVVDAIVILQDPDAGIQEIAKALEKDASLVADVLRFANSAALAGRGEIDSVRAALTRIGTNAVLQALLSSSVGKEMRPAVKGYDLPPEGLWHSSLLSALVVEEIQKLPNTPDHSGAYATALLHDVGKIVLGTYVEVDAEPIFEVAFAGSKTFDEAEQEVLGIDHAEVGARLLESWGLPSAMVEAVRFHHRPQALEGDKTLVALVHLADSLVMMSGVALGREGLSYRIQEDIVEALGVKTKDAEKALALAMIRLQEAIESEGGQA